VYWGGYWAPYYGYWGVGFWVTDWVMLDYLAAEEARRAQMYGSEYVATPVQSTPVVQSVRDELRGQIEELLAAPAAAVPSETRNGTFMVNDPRVSRALGSQHHVWVVSRAVTVTDRSNGGTCVLSQGDLLRSSAPIPSGQTYADVSVAGSKKGSCAPGAIAAVPIVELVHFEESLIDRVMTGAAAAKATETEPEQTEPPPGAPPPPTVAPQGDAPKGIAPSPAPAPASSGMSI
jgi:hypothetical protein